ncbi:ParB/RepB/Spo0J family partition protein [Paucibacter sp. APW11]|uniref:ParB/RepB/Spo0J family partition protein n=1 Tax=Roseateles aquae TaxID=3077235 RepID=A0ABU3P716_9BURK|nr:ParB/RepB/Spo0J family partition protein [Paucibacter sp. APW11]MDT8998373.1 ParB/RepB/Spo0J family partition protein [Paucibacter sp. APW11]
MSTTAIEPLNPSTAEAAQHLPLTLFRRSPTNPRTRFTPAKITELAQSIKKLGGNFTPILARPNPDYTPTNGQPPFEIVAGERRWRASIEAQMPTILALVRNLTDFEALEIQLIENIDREDLHPMEEAHGMQALLRQPKGLQGYTSVDELAARLSRSRRWVYNRLQLLQLCPAAQEAFLDDKLQATVALLIARMPNEAQQTEATERLLAGWGGEPFSYRAASEFLQKEYMLRLDAAPFDVHAIYPTAGPCGNCAKRSGATPELFDDVKGGDMCQDSACYHAKEADARDALLQSARDAGHTMIAGEDARRMVPSPNYLPPGHLWFDQAAPTLTADPRTLRELFGAKQRDAVTVDHPSGKIYTLVPIASAKKVLKAKGLLREEAPAPAEAPRPTLSAAAAAVSPPAATPKQPAPTAEKPRTAAQLEAAIETRANALLGQMLFKAIGDALSAAEEPPLLILRLAIRQLMEHTSAEGNQLLFDARGWKQPTSSGRYDDALASELGQLDGGELAEVLGLALCAEDLTDEGRCLEVMRDEDLPALRLADVLCIDATSIEDEARDAAELQIGNEEQRRRGIAAAPKPDATAAFITAHAAPAVASKPGAKVQIKYRNPATGETWSGRGLQPRWLKAALAAGKTLADFDTSIASADTAPAANDEAEEAAAA